MTYRYPIFIVAAGILFTIGSLTDLQISIFAPSTAFAESQEDKHGDKHEEENEGGVLELDVDKLGGLKLSTAKVYRGTLAVTLELPGEVQWNADRVAHVVPRVTGVVRNVVVGLGDYVNENDLLAELDSGELATAKAMFLAAHAREQLAQTNFTREESLWEQKITAEQDFLEAQNALIEAQIEKRLADRQLHAIGVSDDELKVLIDAPHSSLTDYRVTSPFAGVVVERHIVKGEMLMGDSQVFMIADPSQLWVLASVYEKDIARIKNGQTATIQLNAYPEKTFKGTITWVADTVDEQTRTLTVRIEVNNTDRLLKPGMFARVELAVSNKADVLVIPSSALQKQGGETIVFVDEGGGRFERREVEIGLRAANGVEVLDGLHEGEKIVSVGSFILKSELEKEGFEAGHGH